MMRHDYNPANAEKHPGRYVLCGYLVGCVSLRARHAKMCINCFEVVRRKRGAQIQRRKQNAATHTNAEVSLS